jgi:predicted small secreted protein
MKTAFLRNAALALAATLAACTTGAGGGGSVRTGGIEVGRFHLGEPIAHAQIAVEPFDRADAASPDFAAASAAVARQLGRLGWTVVNTTGQSEQIALVALQSGSREAIAARSAARVGRGFASGPATTAPGGNASLLEVAIRRRSDGTVFWEGRALSDARPGSSEPVGAAAAERLATALFRDFPGESGRIIRVK